MTATTPSPAALRAAEKLWGGKRPPDWVLRYIDEEMQPEREAAERIKTRHDCLIAELRDAHSIISEAIKALGDKFFELNPSGDLPHVESRGGMLAQCAESLFGEISGLTVQREAAEALAKALDLIRPTGRPRGCHCAITWIGHGGQEHSYRCLEARAALAAWRKAVGE